MSDRVSDLRYDGSSRGLPGTFSPSGERPSEVTGLTWLRMVLLGLWLCSFLVSLDVLYQLKPFDLVSPVVMFVYRKELRAFLRSSLLVARSMKWLWLIAVLSSFWTILYAQNVPVVAVISLRLFRFAAYLAAFGVLFTAPLTLVQRKRLIGAVAFGAVAEAGLIILQALDLVPILWPLHEQIYNETIPTGTLALNHVNNVVFMLTGICALMTWSLFTSKWLGWMIAGVGVPAMAAAIVFGQARLGIVGIPLLILSLVFALRAKGILLVVAMVLVAILFGGAVLVGVEDTASMVWSRRMIGKVEETDNPGSYMEMDQSRARIRRLTFEGFAEYPLALITGVGFQNFKFLVHQHAVAAHNLYLELLGELGVPGLIAFLAMMLGLFRLFRLRKHQERRIAQALLIAMALAVTLLILGGANETLYPKRPIPGFLGYVMGYWGLVAGFAQGKWRTAARRRRFVVRLAGAVSRQRALPHGSPYSRVTE